MFFIVLSFKIYQSRKSTICPIVDRLVSLILMLLVSTAPIERAFSTMNLVKTKHNWMENEFLVSYLITKIEKKNIARGFDINCMIDAFNDAKEC